MPFSPEQVELIKDQTNVLISLESNTRIFERERAEEIVLSHLSKPDNDDYWFNKKLKEIAKQIKGEI